jgi:hypothetical protein
LRYFCLVTIQKTRILCYKMPDFLEKKNPQKVFWGKFLC